MRTALTLIASLIAFHAVEANAQWDLRVGVRGTQLPSASVELLLSKGPFAVVPTFEYVWAGKRVSDVRLLHVNAQYRFALPGKHTLWVGGGPTIASVISQPGTAHVWNAEIGFGIPWRYGEAYVAARYFNFTIPVFRDEVAINRVSFGAGLRTSALTFRRKAD